MAQEESKKENGLMGLLSLMDGSQWALFISLWLIFATVNIVFHILLVNGDPYAWGFIKTILNAIPSTHTSYDPALLAA